MINSKAKGNTFERKIANLLSKRFHEFTGLKSSFRRSVDSGSFWGKSNKHRILTHATDKASFGDIVCPPNFRYAIECKHYRAAPGLLALVEGQIKDWDRWIDQARQDSTHAGQHMAIVIKYNNLKEIVVLDDQPAGLPCRVQYRDLSVVALTALLALPDAHFFQSGRSSDPEQ